MASSTSCVMWFRRDLRLGDNPALLEACADGGVLPLFVVDASLWEPSRRRAPGLPRRLPARPRPEPPRPRGPTGRRPRRPGRPRRRRCPRGRRGARPRRRRLRSLRPARDEAVEQALAEHDIELVRTGSPYAVAPGRVHNQQGNPYRVFTPFSKAWAAHGWRGPVDPPEHDDWRELSRSAAAPRHRPARRDGAAGGRRAGRAGTLARLPRRQDRRLRRRPRPPRPRRHLPDVGAPEVGRDPPADPARRPGPEAPKGAATFRKELAWREFYADVLFHQPDSAREYLRPEFARMAYDDPGEQLAGVEGRPHRLSRSSTPACASCGRPAGCTTGCG